MMYGNLKTKFQLGCVVSITRRQKTDGVGSNINDTGERNSISGVLIDEKSGLVLTHASLLAPLTNILPTVMQVVERGFIPLDNLLDKHSCEILIQEHGADDGSSDVLQKTPASKHYYTELLNCSLQTNSKTIHKHNGQVLCVFKCEKFERTLQQLMPSQSGWKFSDGAVPGGFEEADDRSCSEVNQSGPTGDKRKKMDTGTKDEQIDQTVQALLPCFILIRLHSWPGSDSHISPIPIKPSSICRQGDIAEVIGTPFGDLSPDVFMNSYSKGVVCNVAGPSNVLILTDARCIPGSEGGALITTDQQSNKSLVGIITAPLCWKNGEWIGLALVCSLTEVMNSLYKVTSFDAFHPNHPSTDRKMESADLPKSVVLVRTGSTWGSGVLIDREQCLVLTCSHVIKWGLSKTVLLKFGVENKWLKADILYCTPSGQQFDLALLKTRLHPPSSAQPLTLAPNPAYQGQNVCVTGHALFDEDHELEPSVTSGVIAKVTTVRGVKVMLQTTCAVHAGASGGALTDEHGNLLGLVVCNAKDTAAGATFPHVNLCVPLHTVWPIIERYQSTGDKRVLESWHIVDKHVKTLWNLGSLNYTIGNTEATSSKL